MTDAERLLWRHPRAYQLNGRKFRRQQPIGPYVVDFVHFGAKLIVECDGGQHNERADDQERDSWLRQQGFQVLRYWNHQILNETDNVVEDILNNMPPLPRPLSHKGRGE
jgi:very-short-patch-repair endonuclease